VTVIQRFSAAQLCDFKSRPLLSGEQFIRVGSIHKPLCPRIPLQFPAEANCDVCQMACADAAMLTFHI
jgi:hypothetical protein